MFQKNQNQIIFLILLILLFFVISCICYDNQNWGQSKLPTYECGKTHFTSRIVGGINAIPNEFPWMVALTRNKYDYYGHLIKEFFCGGTIITKWYILTAAHCLPASQVFLNNGYNALTGAYKLTESNPYQREYQIHYGIRHSRYNSASFHYDIAVLMTHSEIIFSAAVIPICLPFNNRNDLFEHSPIILIGWGSLGQTLPNFSILQKVSTRIKPNYMCNMKLQQQQNPLLNISEICTMEPNRDSCSSDSGGPVLSSGVRKFLLGIISGSGGGICGKSVGIITRLTSYLNWIEAIINRLNYETNLSPTIFERYSMSEQ